MLFHDSISLQPEMIKTCDFRKIIEQKRNYQLLEQFLQVFKRERDLN